MLTVVLCLAILGNNVGKEVFVTDNNGQLKARGYVSGALDGLTRLLIRPGLTRSAIEAFLGNGIYTGDDCNGSLHSITCYRRIFTYFDSRLTVEYTLHERVISARFRLR